VLELLFGVRQALDVFGSIAQCLKRVAIGCADRIVESSAPIAQCRQSFLSASTLKPAGGLGGIAAWARLAGPAMPLGSASPSRDVTRSRKGVGVYYSNEGGRKVKTTIIALSAAALIAAAPAVSVQGASSKSPSVQHNLSKKRHPGVSGYAPRRVVHAKGMATGYPRASGFGFAPSAPKDYTYENSRNGGGGGGGGSGM
jgi:hypothetical protein